MMNDFIEYEILDGQCSYCGRNAEWIPIDDWSGYFTCTACDSYNADLEMSVDDDQPIIIIPTDDDNINVYF